MRSVVESARGEEDARDAAHTYAYPTHTYAHLHIYLYISGKCTELVYILPVHKYIYIYIHTKYNTYSYRIFKAVDDGDSDGWWR